MEEGLLCGAARSVITPKKEWIPNLRALRDAKIGGVLDDIYLRVLALDNGKKRILLISFELDKALNPKKNLEELSKTTGIPEENILYIATHVHTAPMHSDRPEERINQVSLKSQEVQEATHEYEKYVEEILFQTVDTALHSMQPVKMGYGEGSSYINVKRNQMYEYTDENNKRHATLGLGANAEESVNHKLSIIKFENMKGEPVAYFMNYPVHCAVLHANQCINDELGISGDLAGHVCKWMEEKYNACVAMWSSGAAGDINPIVLNEMYTPNPMTGKMEEWVIPGGDYSLCRMLASRHFADVLKVEKKICCTMEIPKLEGIIKWAYTPACDKNPEKPYEVRLHMLQIGNLYLYAFSGELYSSYIDLLEEIVHENIIYINHDASLLATSGYIFDDKSLELDKDLMLPGHRSTHMKPGFFANALLDNTKEILAEL